MLDTDSFSTLNFDKINQEMKKEDKTLLSFEDMNTGPYLDAPHQPIFIPDTYNMDYRRGINVSVHREDNQLLNDTDADLQFDLRIFYYVLGNHDDLTAYRVDTLDENFNYQLNSAFLTTQFDGYNSIIRV